MRDDWSVLERTPAEADALMAELAEEYRRMARDEEITIYGGRGK